MVRNLSRYLDKHWVWHRLKSIAQVPGRICDHSTIVINGHLCVAGGSVRRGRNQNAGRRRLKFGWNIYPGRFCWYDMKKKEWRPLAPMITARKNFALVQLGEYVYAIGGMGEKWCLFNVERYCISSNQWQPMSSLPVACKDPSAVVYKGKILMYGLKNSSTTSYALQVYTPQDGGQGNWFVALNNQIHAERSKDTPKYALTIQNDKVYRITYENVVESGSNTLNKQITVTQIEGNFESATPQLRVGYNEDQSSLQEVLKATSNCNNIFSINDQLYANVLGCIHKLGVTTATLAKNKKKLEFVDWLNVKENGGSIVLYTFDKNTRASNPRFDDGSLPSWM